MPHFHFHPHPPDKPISAAAGTPYPTPQSEIDILQDRTRARATNPYLSIGRATGSLEKFHRRPRNPREEEALERLEDLQHATDHFGKDVVFKVFDDIDTVFFAGKLSQNVHLSWADCPGGRRAPHAAGVTCATGLEARRVAIQLDNKILQLPTTRLRDVWAVLIHEMVHAFLRVVAIDPSDWDDPDPGHGRHFRRCMAAVQKGLGGKEFIELDVCHDLLDRDRHDSRWESGYRPVGKTRGRSHGRPHGRNRER